MSDPVLSGFHSDLKNENTPDFVKFNLLIDGPGTNGNEAENECF